MDLDVILTIAWQSHPCATNSLSLPHTAVFDRFLAQKLIQKLIGYNFHWLRRAVKSNKGAGLPDLSW
jgi:hypothetical protein